MKRIITLALALCLVFGAALNASAAEIKASGNLWIGYDYLNTDNKGKINDFKQRFRTQIDIVASEALSGTVFFEINNVWGENGDKVGKNSGSDLGTDGVNIQTRRAYIDFMIPNSAVKVRAGLQGFALPGAVSGNVVLNDDLGAIVVSTSYSNVDFTAIYGRPYDNKKADGTDKSDSSIDIYGLVAAINFDTFTVSPYALFAAAGKNVAFTADGSRFNNDAQWYGVALEATPMQNLVLSFDGMYGKAADKDAGFLVAGKAAYTTDFCVPAFVAWYGSGNDSDGEGRMPTLDGGDFVATTLIGEGGTTTTSDAIFGNALGKWGIALQADEITFIEKVSHVARITYVRGTNDDDNVSTIKNWSDDDSAVEFDFVTTYNMYDNLDLIADLAYVATDFDNDNVNSSVDNVFKAGIVAAYSF